MMQPGPHCWNCGYELRGLRVDEACPECGTPIWSTPPPSEVSREAQGALVWGIVSIVLFFACIGPLAGFVAIPAILKGRAALRQAASGRLHPDAARGAKPGLVLGWVTAGLSMAAVVFYALVILVPLF